MNKRQRRKREKATREMLVRAYADPRPRVVFPVGTFSELSDDAITALHDRLSAEADEKWRQILLERQTRAVNSWPRLTPKQASRVARRRETLARRAEREYTVGLLEESAAHWDQEVEVLYPASGDPVLDGLAEASMQVVGAYLDSLAGDESGDHGQEADPAGVEASLARAQDDVGHFFRRRGAPEPERTQMTLDGVSSGIAYYFPQLSPASDGCDGASGDESA